MKTLVHTRAKENCHVDSGVPTKPFQHTAGNLMFRNITVLGTHGPREVSRKLHFYCVLFIGIVFSHLEQQSSSAELCLAPCGHFTPSKAPVQFPYSHLHLITVETNSPRVSVKLAYPHGVSLHCTMTGATLSASMPVNELLELLVDTVPACRTAHRGGPGLCSEEETRASFPAVHQPSVGLSIPEPTPETASPFLVSPSQRMGGPAAYTRA